MKKKSIFSYQSQELNTLFEEAGTALGGFPLGDIEKDFMLNLVKRYSSLYLIEILGFCLMGGTCNSRFYTQPI